MKKIEKLKLNKLSGNELKKRELSQIKGGTHCKCCCGYVAENGIGTMENFSANQSQGYTTSINSFAHLHQPMNMH